MDARNKIPSIDELTRRPFARDLLERHARPFVVELLREAAQALRQSAREGSALPASIEETIEHSIARRLDARRHPLPRPVVNATGVVLHTNLGRAELPTQSIAAIAAVATGGAALEFDLATGKRGDRDQSVEADLVALTGAEAATVVNNNAAAVLLAVNTFGQGREVIVSRGELVEIGGAFRIPEVLEKGGARLVEVGTTNRTHASDYERAISPQTGALLEVHTSNYQVVGFTSAVGLDEMVRIGRARGVAVIEDLGSGALFDFSTLGLPREPLLAESVAAGVDLVCASGDKLLGGPQAGILVGTQAAIAAIKKNPLRRALRPGKLTLAALAAVLRLYREAPDPTAAIPTLRRLARPLDELDEVGDRACMLLRAALGAGFTLAVLDSECEVGSGALPATTLPSRAIAVTHATISADTISARFRTAERPILGRIHNDQFLLDLRTVDHAEDLVPTEVLEP